MRVYNLGIIGFGGMAHHHKTELHDKKFDRVKIHGIYDINPAKLDEAKTYGFKAYSSKEEMFADPDIDMVLVSTTNEAHKSLAIEAPCRRQARNLRKAGNNRQCGAFGDYGKRQKNTTVCLP